MRARSNGMVALACALATLLASCLLAVNATAATFYISPTAPTDDPGCSSGTSPAQAWRSLTKDIHVFRNSLQGRLASMLRLNTAISEPNICMFGNTYAGASGGSPTFSVDGVTQPNDTLPTCGTSGAGQQ